MDESCEVKTTMKNRSLIPQVANIANFMSLFNNFKSQSKPSNLLFAGLDVINLKDFVGYSELHPVVVVGRMGRFNLLLSIQ